MSTFDLFSIGHSNIPAARFIALLRDAGVEAVADVRSTPFSRRFPWFSGKNLAATLAQHGVTYLAHGDALGGRPRDAALRARRQAERPEQQQPLCAPVSSCVLRRQGLLREAEQSNRSDLHFQGWNQKDSFEEISVLLSKKLSSWGSYTL